MSVLAELELRLIRVAVAVCLGDWNDLRSLRLEEPENAADWEPATARAWRETLLQAHLFAGFPRVVEAFGILQERGGLGQPHADELQPVSDDFEAGHELFGRIYGPKADPVRSELESFHPTFARWIEGHAYGRVLARQGLPVGLRELQAVACLAALAQDRQLASHLRGARLVGEPEVRVRGALDAIEDRVPADVRRRAERVLQRLT